MRKSILYIITSISISLLLTGCLKLDKKVSDRHLIITTVYPYQLILQELVDSTFTVETLIPPGASPHTWTPAPADIQKLNSAILTVSNGLDLEATLDKELNNLGNRHVAVARFIPIVTPENKGNSTADLHPVEGESDEHHHDGGNPHLWTSPEYLVKITQGLATTLSILYPSKQAVFMSNRDKILSELSAAEETIKKEREQSGHGGIITFHDSYSYFFEHFGIDFIGAVQPSAGKDPSPRQLKDLADKIKTHKVKAIFIEPQMNPKPAQVLADELRLKVLTYDPLGTTLNVQTIAQYLLVNWQRLKPGL